MVRAQGSLLLDSGASHVSYNQQSPLKSAMIHFAILPSFLLMKSLIRSPGWPQTHYAAGDELVLLVLLPLPPDRWDAGLSLHTWLYAVLGVKLGPLQMLGKHSTELAFY